MSHYERMAEQYRLHPQERSFEWYCDWHIRHGFLFATPEFFIMGRSCCIQTFNPELLEPGAPGDNCWYIHGFSGDMSKAWSILPWELPWIAFERVREGKREQPCFVEIERLRRLSMSTTMEAET
jgi:hypothetical protein